MKKGFTLIELLVVVLIIGILSAVALPGYQKAVEKSKMTQALTIANALQKGMDAYILENGIRTEGKSLDDKGDLLEYLGVDIGGGGSHFYAQLASEDPKKLGNFTMQLSVTVLNAKSKSQKLATIGISSTKSRTLIQLPRGEVSLLWRPQITLKPI